MKHRLLSLVCVVFLASAPHAQLAGGSITGTITDIQGGALSGVAITLQGTDITQTFTTATDGRYRFLDLAPGSYSVAAAREGFTTIVRVHVIVEVGKNVDLPQPLQVAPVAETVNVSAALPVISTKETGTTTNFTADELNSIPTSRDPFALLRTVPGVLVDRVNVGGNETGQQPILASKGTRPQDVGLDARWHRRHRYDVDRPGAHLLQLRQFPGDPGLHGRPGYHPADRRGRTELRHQARRQSISRRRPRVLR